jgi:DNA replication regulator DPB11
MEVDMTEESMRVTYEDPGERDEKKRLMSILESQGESDSTTKGGRRKGKGVVRRSLRVAGF